MKQAPIGIFDSGVGGLTVARAVLDQVPGESVRYVGDTAHGPYGPLPIAQVRAHALRVMDDLVDSGVKMLVIACNSASAAVLRDARERYTGSRGIPVVEVIQPAVRRAVAMTRNHKVGVVATQATVTSQAYEDAFAAATHLDLTTAAAPRFVEFVERGITAGGDVLEAAAEYLAPLRRAQVDTLVLGCTHYPLLTGVLQYVMGDDVTLVSSAEETAKDVYRVLLAHDLVRDDGAAPVHRFLATGDTDAFDDLAHRFLGPEVGSHSAVEITGEIPKITAAAGPGAGPVPGVRTRGGSGARG
ncbi:glutamate racemase [Pseudactinotalea sp. Z1739]|uniref:glutamate racemase n=1 Tax=Pseudactinotalea sp. Z1739 TaxID=3413028 RepID=UPI003C79F394